MKTKDLKSTITFKTSPHEVYEMLMDSKKHADLIKSKAKISRKVGGKFSVFNGSINGVNLELVKDHKIIQSWHANDWPKDYYSKIEFVIEKIKDKAKVKFTHTGIPENSYESVKTGWHEFYWNPMKEMTEKKTSSKGED